MTFKIVTIALSIFIFLFNSKAFATTRKGIDNLSENLGLSQSYQEKNKGVYIGNIHDELVIMITDFLKEDLSDLQALAATNHSHYNLIMKHTPYVSPQNQTDVSILLKKTPFDHIRLLSYFWKKGSSQETTKYLQEIREQYVGYGVPQPSPQQAFKIHLKSLQILYIFGDQTVKESFKKLYEMVQSELHETVDNSEPGYSRIIDSKHYIEHYKAFANLNPEVREILVKNYREGIEPFSKNERKAAKFEKKFILPLNSKTVYFE